MDEKELDSQSIPLIQYQDNYSKKIYLSLCSNKLDCSAYKMTSKAKSTHRQIMLIFGKLLFFSFSFLPEI